MSASELPVSALSFASHDAARAPTPERSDANCIVEQSLKCKDSALLHHQASSPTQQHQLRDRIRSYLQSFIHETP